MLDVGCGEGQISRLARREGAELVVGLDPTWSQVRVAVARDGGPRYLRSGAAALPLADATFDAVVACLVFEHIVDVDAAIAEVARVLRPGGRFLFFLNHPLLQTPSSGWIDDQVLDPPEQYWRIGPYLVEDHSVEEVEKDVFIPFIHRPLSRYVNALADNGLLLTRMEEPAPPPGFLARAAEYEAASSIPRLLLLRDGEGGDAVTGPAACPHPAGRLRPRRGGGRRRPVRGRALDGRRCPGGRGLVRHRQPAAIADPQGRRADRGGRQRRLPAHRPRRRDRPAPGGRAAGAAVAGGRPACGVRTLFLDASTEMLVLRYKVGRRRHPLSVGSLTDAVERERQLLEPVRAVADLVVDTTNLNVHQLRDRVLEAFAQAGATRTLHTRVVSFGYKQGVPTDADMVLDCRFLPNPHWVEELRPLSGTGRGGARATC